MNNIKEKLTPKEYEFILKVKANIEHLIETDKKLCPPPWDSSLNNLFKKMTYFFLFLKYAVLGAISVPVVIFVFLLTVCILCGIGFLLFYAAVYVYDIISRP